MYIQIIKKQLLITFMLANEYNSTRTVEENKKILSIKFYCCQTT